MNSKSNFNKSDGIKLSLFVFVLGLATIYSKSISNYLLESYNSKIEFLASNTFKGTYTIRH